MALSFGKRDTARMAAVLDGEYSTVEEAAEAALAAAMEIIESKAKFTVVGQIDQTDNKGDKYALGWYATATQARNHALSLTYSTQTKETGRAWVLPVHHGTPAELFKERKDIAKAGADDVPWRERELARRIKWCADNPDSPPPPEWQTFLLFDSHSVECDRCHGLGRVPRDLAPDAEYR